MNEFKPIEIPDINLLSDNAISEIKHDEFGRDKFIHAIAKVIHSQTSKVNPKEIEGVKKIDEPMTVGLYGPWGSGKSSIVNLINEYLRGKSVETVFFNPWMYKSEDELMLSLFNTILNHSGLSDYKKEELIRLLKKYQPIASLISKELGTATKEYTTNLIDRSKLNAVECKEKIDNILRAKANPLVIFIDDVDRLSKKDVHVLFKTIRLIASFQHVIYVVAFDFEMVAKSIKENYADGTIEDGKSFIEKIIQIPIRIPEIKPHLLSKYASAFVKKSAGIEVLGNRTFQLIIENFYHTPRDIKRAINAFRFSYSFFYNEIDPVDLLLIELIRIKNHHLFEIIRIYYQVIIGKISEQEQYDKFIIYAKNNFDVILLNDSINSKNKELIRFNAIFKTVFGSNSCYSTTYELQLAQHRRDSFKLKEYLNRPEIKELKTFKNPKILVHYLENMPSEKT